MANSKANVQLDKTEKHFIAELKMKPSQELSNFLAGPWTASILSSETIEELYQYQKLHKQEETTQQQISDKGM